MLFLLALIYSQYAMRKQANPFNAGSTGEMRPAADTATATAPLPAAVTPGTVADDLIDEALADRDDLSSLVEDEMADVEEGN